MGHMLNKEKPERGDVVRLSITDAGEGNRSFGRLENGMAVFVRGLLVPGDEVHVRLGKVKKRYAEATLEDVITPSVDRIEPRCSFFGRCGGCRWQHVSSETQLIIKTRRIVDAMTRLGGFEDVPLEPAVVAEKAYLYRNKVDFVFSRNQDQKETDEKWSLGFHVHGVGNSVIDIDPCLLVPEEMNRIASLTRAFASEKEWNAWDSDKRSGLLRSLTIRESQSSGQRLVNLITSGPMPNPNAYAEMLMKEDDLKVVTVVNTVAIQKNRQHHEHAEVIAGPGVLEETMMGVVLSVSPSAFVQPNIDMAEKVYAQVLDWAALTGRERVLDLYCGIGVLSQAIARQAGQVYGYESVVDAIRDARTSAQANGVENVKFTTAILGHDETLQFPGNLDLVVTDPPRDGMEAQVVERIIQTGVKRILYISCHPASLARDGGLLRQAGYELKKIRPFDLFPQTDHIETVACFER